MPTLIAYEELSSYPNQFYIYSSPKTLTKSNYLGIGNDEWIEASKNLTHSAFQFYLYLAKNDPSVVWKLSCKATCEVFGFSSQTYHRAFKELVNKGYLVKRENSNNSFDLHLIPCDNSN